MSTRDAKWATIYGGMIFGLKQAVDYFSLFFRYHIFANQKSHRRKETGKAGELQTAPLYVPVALRYT